MVRAREEEEPPSGDSGPGAAPVLASQETLQDARSQDVLGAEATMGLTLTILGHPEPRRVGETAVLHDLAPGRPWSLSRLAPDFVGDGSSAPLGDRNLSRSPLQIGASPEGIRIDLGECRKRVTVQGRLLHDGLDVSWAEVKRGVVMDLSGRVVVLLHQAPSVTATGTLFATRPGDSAGSELVGASWAIRLLRHDIRRVADLDIPVLVRGESGSGKELVAAAIHRASGRSAGPFVAVNLGAVPASLASAELFGAERGAYSGAASKRQGYFQQAHQGTLFLDEIGEAPAEIQVALLRALDTGQVQPVGSPRPQTVDVRVIAATDADLEEKIETGGFKAPLLHRLAAFELSVPPLRERRDDIGRLLRRFVEEELSRLGEATRYHSAPETGELWFPSSLVARLADCDWPGNVRQLRNVVRQLVIGSRGRERVEMSPAVERQLRPAGSRARDTKVAFSPPPPSPAPNPGPRRAPLTEDSVEDALRRSRWDIAGAAQTLAVSRAAVYAVIDGSPRFRKAGDLSTDELGEAYRRCGGDVARMVDDLRVSERALRRRLREIGLDA